MKKIIMLLLGAGIMFSASAQQQSKTDAVSAKNESGAKGTSSNIERTRIVNEKIAADKANAAAAQKNKRSAVKPQHLPLNGKTPPATRPTNVSEPLVKTKTAHTGTAQKTSGQQIVTTTPATQNAGSSIQQQREEGRAKSQQLRREGMEQHKPAPRTNNTKITTSPTSKAK